MLRNYIKISMRNLLRSRSYFMINLLGLIIGITAFVLIVLWIKAETSYDTFHENAENIYRVDYILYEEGILEQHSASGSTGVGKEIMNAFPEVYDYTRFTRTNALVSNKENVFKETDILYASSSFFNVFTFPLIAGVADSNLLALNHAVLTEETAKKYFGNEDPIGKTITLNGGMNFEVTGVARNVPENSHFKFDILLSYENLIRNSAYWDNYWVSERVYTYIQVVPGADVEALQAKLPQIPEEFIGDFMKEAFFLLEYKLQNLTDIHLHSSVSNELEVNGSYRSVVSLGLIAVLVLLIAFVNYINLATSRSMERIHEVGLRKVSGACRRDIVYQFLTESVLLNLFAVIVSLTGIVLLLPYFKDVMQSPLQISYPGIALLFTALLVAGSLFTGLLPAVYVSRFAPALVLKGKAPTGSQWLGRFKNGLVIFQFSISIILIISTLIINRQLRYMDQYDLGVDIEQVLVLEGPRIITADSYESYMEGLEAFKNEIMAQSMVINITGSSSVPGEEINNWRVFGVPVSGRNTEKKIKLYYADNRFFDTYGLNIIAGRNFNPSFQEESNQLILNESALPYYGYEDARDAVGRTLMGSGQEVTIIGVVNDFNQESLKELPEPIAFFKQPANVYYSIKANMAGIGQLIPELENIWKTHYPGNPFNYFFLNDYYNEQYRADRRFGVLLLSSSILAIFIACLGLLGLSVYAIARRTKEIGIRKANGARTLQVIVLLNKDFVKWVFIAIIIAIPVAWFTMSRWLDNFAYKTAINWILFALAGLLALGIALLTVSWQSYRAASRNPVEALKYE